MTQETEQKFRTDHRMKWYQEAKFGLFIHWGAYSVAGIEASWPMMVPVLSAAMFGTELSITEEEYTALPAQFNPVDFNPDEWVQLAKEAGMRYIIFTSKHHDGFCMFDAPGTDYKITNTLYGKDICLELSQACSRAGMPLGFYYSPPDMHHPGYRDTSRPITKNWIGEPKRKEWREYLDTMESHIRKLLTDYGEVSVIWFDGLANHGKYDPERFHKLIHELSPNTLINDRLGKDYDFITPEQFVPMQGIPAITGKPNPGMDPGGDGFFALISKLSTVPLISGLLRKHVAKNGVSELTKVHQEPFPSPDRFQPWETCMTMGASWAHNPREKNWKAPGKLVRNLVDVASHGGNYLLNVGPTARGTLPTEAVERLQHIGRWMNTYHPAIYGSTYTSLQGQAWGQATRKGEKIYLHIYNWPADGTLTVDAFPGQARTVKLFAGKALAYKQTGKELKISLPSDPPDPDVSVLEIGIDPTETGWSHYSAPVITTVEPKKYIKDQAVASFVINAVLNGLIAFFSYRMRGIIPYSELAIDIIISVFIITFFTSWIVVGSARGEVRKGNLDKTQSPAWRFKLPKGAGLRALVIAMVIVLVFGGLFLDGLIYLISPSGVSSWVYIVLKILYTGTSGALASALTILSIVSDENRS
ncbi:MAG: alpha-L-fucosidase [Chloroflexota bacterium]|nr:alpha-L-fucosidase [Chloroflexota bacterium]